MQVIELENFLTPQSIPPPASIPPLASIPPPVSIPPLALIPPLVLIPPPALIPPPHESSTLTPVSDLTTHTSMQEHQTDACDTAPKKSSLSSSTNAPSMMHGLIQGMLMELQVDLSH